jgi:hypothetical protein
MDDDAALSYLLMCSSFFAQVWIEQKWRDRFPIRDVRVDTRPFATYTADRVECELQENQVKEFGYNAYTLLLPIGGKGLARRTWGGRGGAPRTILNKMNGTSIIHEIDELFDTQASLKLIAYDDQHPLQDPLALMLVQMTCSGNSSTFSMVSRCTLASCDLMHMGAALEVGPAHRRPLIVRLCNEWMVQDPQGTGSWVRPSVNKFSAAWLVFLSLLKQNHHFSLDTLTDLRYWEQVLGVSL